MRHVYLPHLSADERMRAKEAFKLCELLRHPGDKAIIDMLDGGTMQTHLTAQDFRNARKLFGVCPACTEAKMTRPIHRTTKTEPARNIGDHFHGDILILKTKSVGGNNFILAGIDEKSAYGFGIPTASKAEKFMKAAAEEIMREYNTHGHRLKQFSTDDESALALLDRHLGPHGVQVHQTPADLHEKSAERFIRTVKNKKRSILCSLWYEPLPELECEAYLEAIAWYNRLPNTTTGPSSTPHTLFLWMGLAWLVLQPKEGSRSTC
jgi:hypothetical protein